MSAVELPASRAQRPLSEAGWASLQPALAGRIVAPPELLLSRLLGEPLWEVVAGKTARLVMSIWPISGPGSTVLGQLGVCAFVSHL